MARQRVWKQNKIEFSQQMQTCVPLQIQICVPLKIEKMGAVAWHTGPENFAATRFVNCSVSASK